MFFGFFYGLCEYQIKLSRLNNSFLFSSSPFQQGLCDRNYNPQFVFFHPTFWKLCIYYKTQKILLLLMVSIQEQFLIKNQLNRVALVWYSNMVLDLNGLFYESTVVKFSRKSLLSVLYVESLSTWKLRKLKSLL